MSEYNQNNIPEQENDFQLMDFVKECLGNWKWFLLSLFVCGAIAVAKILTTPPVYQRVETVMIKADSRGRSISNDVADFSNFGLVTTNTNVIDEMQALSSQSNMLEVVKRLHLDMNYYEEDRFYDKVLYGSTLPVSVLIDGLSDQQSASFDIDFEDDGRVILSNFILKKEKFSKKGTISCALGDTVRTPVGSVVISPTLQYGSREYSTIHVKKVPAVAAARSYSTRFESQMSSVSSNKSMYRQSNIVVLALSDICIARAEDILNTLVAVYNENWVKDRNQVAVSTSFFINDRLSLIEQELASVDEDISKYKKENLVPDVKAASNVYFNQSTTIQRQIQDLSNELYMSRHVRDFLADEGNKFQVLPVNSGISSSSIEGQIKDYNSQVMQRSRLVSSTSEMNPLVVDLDAAIASMRQAIVISIENQILSLETQIRNLEANENKTQAQLAANPDQAQYLLSVERQQTVKESLYLFLLQKREENELSQAFTAYNTRVIDPPTGSNAPIAPARSKIMLIAILLGLCIPAGFLYVRRISDTAIRDKKDLGRITIPFLGEIPMSYNDKKKILGRRTTPPNPIVVKAGNRNYINESFRVLRTNLEFICQEDGHSVIAITSFNPGSGKSFITANLAISLAIKEKNVLMIDGDFRHASLSQFINSPKEGFSGYLGGQHNDLKSIVYSGDLCPNLDVLPVGALPPNPTELISSSKFSEAIKTLADEYDFVFIDCPPIDIVADAQIIEKCSSRTIFIVRAGLLERSMLPELQSIYTNERFKNLSLVLNGVTAASKKRYGYHYGSYYGHNYYASGEEKK